MEQEIEKAVLGSVRLDADVWEAVRSMPESLNQYLRRELLGAPRKVNRREAEVRKRAASDLAAVALERDDIDYSDVESGPTTHVGALDAVAPGAGGAGKVSLESWRKARAPIPKPGEKGKK